MRLYNYLNEDIEKELQYYNPIERTEIDVAWNKIQKECKPFLRDIKNADSFLYRGMMHGKGTFFKKKVRKNRVPTTTTKSLHEAYDRYFNEKFGWKARSNGLFVTGSTNDAGSYGRTYMIFPIGNYKFVWSEDVGDLFIYGHDNNLRSNKHMDFKNTPPEEYYQTVKNVMDKASYTDKNIVSAINSENEIMINSDTYYALDIFYKPVMEELVFKGKVLSV